MLLLAKILIIEMLTICDIVNYRSGTLTYFGFFLSQVGFLFEVFNKPIGKSLEVQTSCKRFFQFNFYFNSFSSVS